jgi:SAM-dependent methyltransferase
MAFSSHNVLLPDGTETAPGLPLVAESQGCIAALRALYEEFGENHTGVTVADLGSLEGGYAAEFARAGFEVYGIEARKENHDNACLLQDALALGNLHFVQGDVRSDLLEGGQFDVIFCSGLLYHLDKPVEFLNLLGQATRQMLILNTHYSLEGGHPESSHHPGSGCDYREAENEGRKGHWYRESISRWDSFGNESSFWLRKDELIASLQEAGFYKVEEIPDWQSLGGSGHVPGGPGMVSDRGMFLAFKG